MPGKKQRKGVVTHGNSGNSSGSSSGKNEGYYERPSDPERAKLRPVLELLDDQKPRLALKSVDGVLKKWPRSLRALALRALCLARMGSTAESVAAAERVLACAPRDPELLSLLLLVLRPAGLAARLTPLYEAAWLHGGTPELGEALFLCHVRDRNYAAQQQLIGQLATRFPHARTPFLWWRVASLYAQARLVVPSSSTASTGTATTGEDKEREVKQETGADGRYANVRLLGLCEVLAARLLADGQMRTAHEAELYVAILRDLRRDARLVELLEEADGGAPRSTVAALLPLRVERLEVLAEAHEHLAHWARARAIYETLLRMPEAHRNWRHFQGLVRCVVALREAEAETAVATARAFLAELRAVRADRGVLLAALELETRVGGADATDRVRAALCEYARHFCSKPACAVDVRPYLRELVVVRGVAPDALVTQLREACGCPTPAGTTASSAEEEEEEKRPLEELCKEVFFIEVERMVGLHAAQDVGALESTLRAVLRVYCAVLAREAPRDGAPSSADELAVLAAATFADVWARTGDEALLFEAACFLEEVLARTPNNAQARLALIGVYTRLGALDGALAHFGSAYMGVKGVLLESCAHLVVHDAAVVHCNAGDSAARLFAQVLAVHHENHTAVPEQLVQGYAAGAYVPAVDIARFHGRLRRSALQRYVLTERCLAQYLSLAPADYAAAFARLDGLPAPACPLADLDCTTSDTRAALADDLAPVGRDDCEDSKDNHARTRTRRPPAFLTVAAIARREAAARVLLAAGALARSASATGTAGAEDLAAAVRALDAALAPEIDATDAAARATLAARIAETDLAGAPDVAERHAWELFAAVAHFAVLAVTTTEGEGNDAECDAAAAAVQDALAAVRAAVDGAPLGDFGALCRALAAVVTQGVCWASVLLVAAVRGAAGRGARGAARAGGVRAALVDAAAHLHGRALPALAQTLFRDPARAAAVNARFADPARAHVPAGFVARDAAADRVTAINESRGTSLVAIIQSMSGLVATSF